MTIMVTIGLLAGRGGFTNQSTDSSGQHYLCSTTGNVATHSQEDGHGPHNGILPQWALPCQVAYLGAAGNSVA